MSARIGSVLMVERILSVIQSRCIIAVVHLICDLVDQVGRLVLEVVHGRGLVVGGSGVGVVHDGKSCVGKVERCGEVEDRGSFKHVQAPLCGTCVMMLHNRNDRATPSVLSH